MLKSYLFFAIVQYTYGWLLPVIGTRRTRTSTNIKKLSTLHMNNANIEDAKLFDWSWADDCYLITTTVSSERLERTKNELQQVNLLNRVQIRTFQPDDSDRVRGCYTSHIKVLEEIQKKLGKKKDYRVIVLEDNLESTLSINPSIVDNVAQFVTQRGDWDVFHLAYMMYVPGLNMKRLTDAQNVVAMFASESAAVGTSAYIISKKGVETVLENHKKYGYTDAIPNIMSRLFPSSRYAAYPMIFHRAAKVGSLVNPQLDDFRKIMFSPIMYTTWEKLMVSTGLQNNQLFPGLSITLLLSTIAGIYSAATGADQNGGIPAGVFLAFPLLVAAWGATLFTSGGGFAKKQGVA